MSEQNAQRDSSDWEVFDESGTQGPRSDANVAVASDGPQPRLTVAVVGASAGGFEAITEMLEQTQAEGGAAWVIVQHLSPHHESLLADGLRPKCPLAIVKAEDGALLEADTVYVMPPNALLTFDDGRVCLSPRTPDGKNWRPINDCFASLASQADFHPVAVVLSGSGSDGAAGVREVKAAGGIVFAQSPETCKFDHMPQAAIATGLVDEVLAPAKIAAEVERIAAHPCVKPPSADQQADAEATQAVDDGQYQRIFNVLRRQTGVDFTHYKRPTFRRRMHRRMILHRITRVEDYVQRLEQDPAEATALFNDVLIHVTSFFRDPKSFEVLRDRVFPRITEERNDDEPVRIWVPGCATGEEVYSVAMELVSFLGDGVNTLPIQIFATDVSESAVEKARQATYPAAIADEVPPDRLKRFFRSVDGHYRLQKSIRDLCVFARQDLTRDPPFSRMDLVMCRNVLIYLGPPLQSRLLSVLHYALKPNRFLLLGGSETVGPQSDLFEVVDKKHRLYTKRAVATPPNLTHSMPLTSIRSPEDASDGGGKSATSPRSSLTNEINHLLLNRYSPPGVLIDSEHHVLQFHGRTGEFLEPAPGEASFNLFQMARKGLLHGLRESLAEASEHAREAVRRDVRVKVNDHVAVIDLRVLPVRRDDQSFYLVLFEPSTADDVAVSSGADVSAAEASAPRAAGAPGAPGAAGEAQHARVDRLQQELDASRGYLQSIIQDLEAANEELQSANEEILSSNEELQSTNEELDTAREELQSTNEELNTVNEELHGRNDELSRVNSDLENLLGSVQIAIVMVGSDLKIRRFTPTAERVLNLRDSDVGRPLAHIRPNINCSELEALTEQAIEAVEPVEREVTDASGRWYSLRIRPYKDMGNRIDGAVLALFDIDTVKHSQQRVEAARSFAEAIVETTTQPLLVLSEDLRVQKANHAFCATFAVEAGTTEGTPLYELGDGQWDIPELRRLLEEVLTRQQKFEGYEVEHAFPGIGKRRMRLNGRKLESGRDHETMILLAIDDVTGR